MNRKPAFETWSAGPGYAYLLTEDSNFAGFLRHEIGPGALYERGRKVIAWQFLLKTAEVAEIVRQYVDQNAGASQGPQLGFSAIDSKQVTGAEFPNLTQDERSTFAMRKTLPRHQARRKSHLAGHLDMGAV